MRKQSRSVPAHPVHVTGQRAAIATEPISLTTRQTDTLVSQKKGGLAMSSSGCRRFVRSPAEGTSDD